MTREEAIKRIKAWNLDSDDMEVLATIIPELRESDDERIRKALIEVLHRLPTSAFDYGAEGGYLGATKEQMLAYLEKQKQEWNDEDEAILSWCVSDIERAKHCASQTQPELCDIEINWLKSLKPQPHWKPRDEQMEALKNSAYGAYQNGDGPALRELYEQLENFKTNG